jgi:hypothetical protein
MENDTIRSSGGNTLVDLWVEGKVRGICVSRGAIAQHMGIPIERANALSDEECCEFVRTRLALVMAAAKDRLRQTGPNNSNVVIDLGHLGATGAGDRRRTERRKSERRKADQPHKVPVTGDRRRGDRRKADRRKRAGDR